MRAGRLVAVLSVVVLVAGCASAESATTTIPGSSTTTTVASTTTTTAASTTTTTAASTTTTTAASTTTTQDTNALADGSGCTPGTSAGLPDGEWFGYIESAGAGSVGFDLACWFTGDPAARAAAEDGEESPPNDYYVRNVNAAIRTMAVAADTGVIWMPNPGDPNTEEMVPYADWLAGRAGRSFQPGVWLTIEGGAVTFIREQYTP